MRHLWIFVHLLGIVLWLGGGLAAMTIGLSLRQAPRDQLASGVRILSLIYGRLMLPGSVATVVSGLVLTLLMYSGPGALGAASHLLMTMQGAGLVAALITLLLLTPGAARLVRVDPIAQAAQFDQLRARQARLGMISGVFGLIALIAGAWGRP